MIFYLFTTLETIDTARPVVHTRCSYATDE